MRTGSTFPEVEPANGAGRISYGSGATINHQDGKFTVERDRKQGPVRKMRGLIAGATQAPLSWHRGDPQRREIIA
jgi:hypothetical protein